MASTPVDIFIHDTYFIVAHIHYVVFGGSIFGIFAGHLLLVPKMFGRMMNETLGKIHFWLHAHLLQRHVLPDAHPRRRRPHAPHLQPDAVRVPAAAPALERVHHHQRPLPRRWRRSSSSSTSSGASCAGQRAASATRGTRTRSSGRRPRPPPHGNFPGPLPTVYRGPYEYSSPLVAEDYLPQARRLEPAGSRQRRPH